MAAKIGARRFRDKPMFADRPSGAPKVSSFAPGRWRGKVANIADREVGRAESEAATALASPGRSGYAAGSFSTRRTAAASSAAL